MTTLDDLKAAAQAATPGPWEADDFGGIHMDGTSDGYRISSGSVRRVAQLYMGDPTRQQNAANARYIAKANPETVLDLIARLEAAERVVAAGRIQFKPGRKIDRFQNALLAAIRAYDALGWRE